MYRYSRLEPLQSILGYIRHSQYNVYILTLVLFETFHGWTIVAFCDILLSESCGFWHYLLCRGRLLRIRQTSSYPNICQ